MFSLLPPYIPISQNSHSTTHSQLLSLLPYSYLSHTLPYVSRQSLLYIQCQRQWRTSLHLHWLLTYLLAPKSLLTCKPLLPHLTHYIQPYSPLQPSPITLPCNNAFCLLTVLLLTNGNPCILSHPVIMVDIIVLVMLSEPIRPRRLQCLGMLQECPFVGNMPPLMVMILKM